MDRNKIVFISTYFDIKNYGIRMLSSILKSRGFNTYIIFLNAPFGSLYSREVLEQVVELSRGSLFVGVSLMTNFFERARQVTLFLRKHLEIPIVWGGIHTAIKPYECLEYADIICIGEAEDSITSFSEGLKFSNDIDQINNFWFNKNGKIIKNKIDSLTKSLNLLPLPDYEYTNHFVIDNGRLTLMNLKLMERYLGHTYATMVTRGCFFKCSYCANNFFAKNFNLTNAIEIRSRAMEDVMNELVWVKKHLDFVRVFEFADDLFMNLTKDTIETFCKLYKKSGLGLPLNISGLHPLFLKEDKIKLLADIGLQYVRMGIQSGSRNIRKLYNRSETNNKIMESVNIIHKYKSQLKDIRYDFIIDNPWETLEDIKDSLRLLVQIPKPYELQLFSLTLYPGTELYNKAKDEGIIKDEFSQIYRKDYLAPFVNDKHRDNAAVLYYNRLFKIISMCRFPKCFFIFLIENESRSLARVICFILIARIDFVVRLRILIYLVKEGILDIVKGKFDRLKRFMFMQTKFVRK